MITQDEKMISKGIGATCSQLRDLVFLLHDKQKFNFLISYCLDEMQSCVIKNRPNLFLIIGAIVCLEIQSNGLMMRKNLSGFSDRVLRAVSSTSNTENILREDFFRHRVSNSISGTRPFARDIASLDNDEEILITHHRTKSSLWTIIFVNLFDSRMRQQRGSTSIRNITTQCNAF